MVWMLTTGISSGNPSNDASVETSASPSTIRLTSKDVPPMSMQIRLAWPVSRARDTPPIAPPTGPDSRVWTVWSLADRAVMIPPEDCMM